MFPKAGQWVWPNCSADDKQDHHTDIYIHIFFFKLGEALSRLWDHSSLTKD